MSAPLVRSRGGAAAALWLAGLVLLGLSIALTITIGPADIAVTDVWAVVGERLGFGDAGLSLIREGIIWDLRLPRTVLAAVCGAGLGLCGVVMQSLLRNPLADPYVLGISSGASTGAVLVVVLGIGSGVLSLSLGAFLGSLVSFTLVMLLSHFVGGTADRVILAGVAAMQLFSALTSFIVMSVADSRQTRSVLFWLLGSLSGTGWFEVWLCLGALLAVLVVCTAKASSLDAFTFGQDAAASLGVAVARTRMLLLVVTALLTATLVSSSGAIGFVGLVLPHAARAIVGPGHRGLLPTTALAGAIFLVWIDTIARTALDPQEIPVGVMTSLVGVPAFVVILYRSRKVH
ncbi:iron complex transport system permease protein [Actinopolyspora xinjiangensis]|uniref:Iron complex transport system permease protein n=1 Tax=Actinopolyspora xinjiangensis TaxID=405564 RepID=A0A1H0QNT5_9ACTN|nr:iron chelate uptake ABC transporter family permease subunit [Actinopolyspora xinjiangensis]SDP18396.1 iron complex transport system permease protein [Actinopolyspora xinjiangensis]